MSCAGQIAIAAIKAIGAGAMTAATAATAATAGVVAIEVSGVRVKYHAFCAFDHVNNALEPIRIPSSGMYTTSR